MLIFCQVVFVINGFLCHSVDLKLTKLWEFRYAQNKLKPPFQVKLVDAPVAQQVEGTNHEQVPMQWS